MTANALWFWLGLFGLGAYHGINPGMGWLFAVALGLQEKSRRAVYGALLPMALGHILATGAIVLLVGGLGVILSATAVRAVAALGLVAFGLYRLLRRHHPKWVGMRVSWRDLTMWSCLMASAHGAGLMLVPVLLGRSTTVDPTHGHHALFLGQMMASAPTAFLTDLVIGGLSVGVHTLGYLIVMGLVALIVYEKLGLALLRHTWFNLDLLWGGALVTAGMLTWLL